MTVHDRTLTPASPNKELRGRIWVHPRGFGFLNTLLPSGETLQAFVAPPDLNSFLCDDLVLAQGVAAPDGRLTATGLTLLERPRTRLFGTVVLRRGAAFLRADREIANSDWPLDLEAATPALREGAYVIARIQGQRLALLRALPADADLSLEQVIARHDLPEDFDGTAQGEAAALADQPHSPAGRRDLRGVPTVTVDAPSTRDIDDAIAVLPAGSDGALRLLVSIADVAGFLAEGSPLDDAARERGTSVYLAGRVLPMLPERLSGGWLSLLPGEDRCCLTVEMRIDPEGRITATDVYEGLMRSSARLHYEEMAEYLDHGRVSAAMEPVRAALPWFRTAAARLALARTHRGGMKLVQEEARITLDPLTGNPAAIESVRPTSAHLMIEHFMVAANEAIAGWLHSRGVPALYRAHDQPDERSVAEFGAAAAQFGFAAGFGRVLTPLSLAAFDRQIYGAPCESALRAVLRRSLGPARYTCDAAPHFGLAAPLYLHFTSPIRRYADLCVHRVVKRYLHGQRRFEAEERTLVELGEHLNRRARTAAKAESDRQRILMARLAISMKGQVFTAHVTRIRPAGLVAQLDASFIEGLIPAESLPGGPHRPDARGTALCGSTRTFPLGMAVQVRVVGADPLVGRVDLALEDACSAAPIAVDPGA